jgi:hypothetical protein
MPALETGLGTALMIEGDRVMRVGRATDPA